MQGPLESMLQKADPSREMESSNTLFQYCKALGKAHCKALCWAVAVASLAIGAFAQVDDKIDPRLAFSKSGKRASYVPPTSELYRALAPAVAKIVIKKYGIPMTTGSGFFAAQDGTLVTSRSLLTALLGDSATTAEITLFDKTTYSEFKVLHCSILDEHPLCSLKLNLESKVFLKSAGTAPNEGDGASFIAHPRGMDFTITRGTVAASPGTASAGTHPVPSNAQITVSAAFAPETVGAGIFNDQGFLIGVVSQSNKSEANIITPISELTTLLESEAAPMSLEEARKNSLAVVSTDMHRRATQELDPALGFAAKAKSLAGLTGFKDVGLVFDNRTLRLSLPEIFDDCQDLSRSRQSTTYRCHALGQMANLSIERLPSKGFEDLLLHNGRRIQEPHPIDVVDELIQQDRWSETEKDLTPLQKRAFFSSPSLAQCQTIRAIANTGTHPDATSGFSNAPACRFSVSHDGESNASSVNVWLLKDQYLYQVKMWTADNSLNEYFSRIPTLAILTARWESPLENLQGQNPMRGIASELSAKPLPTYKVHLPDAVSFMGAKIKGRKSQLDLYGKKLLLDQFEDGFVIAVSGQKHVYLPPDFDDVTKTSMTDAIKALNTKVDLQTLEIEPVNIVGQAARLLTVFGKDSQKRDVLVLTCSIFYKDQTFEITEIATTKDPAETFREFKEFLSGFKSK